MLNNTKELTLLQNNFVLAYTAFGMDTYANGMLSIIAAGGKGKTENALKVTASRMLTYANVRAKIKAIEATRTAQAVVRTGMTIERMHKQYDEDRKFARKCNQAGAACSASVSTARLYGFDKDNAIGEKTVIVIGPRIAQDRREVVSETQEGARDVQR